MIIDRQALLEHIVCGAKDPTSARTCVAAPHKPNKPHVWKADVDILREQEDAIRIHEGNVGG